MLIDQTCLDLFHVLTRETIIKIWICQRNLIFVESYLFFDKIVFLGNISFVNLWFVQEKVSFQIFNRSLWKFILVWKTISNFDNFSYSNLLFSIYIGNFVMLLTSKNILLSWSLGLIIGFVSGLEYLVHPFDTWTFHIFDLRHWSFTSKALTNFFVKVLLTYVHLKYFNMLDVVVKEVTLLFNLSMYLFYCLIHLEFIPFVD